MNNDLETIKHAAIITENDLIIIGKSHSDCFNKAIKNNLKIKKDAKAQGFFTSKGRYVSRHKAAVIAFIAKQINLSTDILFSEDLWCEMYDGKHNYNDEDGYYLKEMNKDMKSMNKDWKDAYDKLDDINIRLNEDIINLKKIISKELNENDELGSEYVFISILKNENEILNKKLKIAIDSLNAYSELSMFGDVAREALDKIKEIENGPSN